jgi:hypothetical protein
MPRIYHSKNIDSSFTHTHAYDEFSNYMSLESAINLSTRKWYLDADKKVELIPRFKGTERGPHWAVKSDQKITIDGQEYIYSSNKDSESREHKLFKGSIIENCFFMMGPYKIRIQDPVEEWRIFSGRFRADVKCSLLCGTPAIIEVIKTSDLSESKQHFLEENEILTFKIYIDEYGNQDLSRIDYIGIGKAKGLSDAIRKEEGALAEITERAERELRISKSKLHEEGRRIEAIFKERKEAANREISQFGSSMEERFRRYYGESVYINREIEQTEESIASVGRQIEECEKKIEESNELFRATEQRIEHMHSEISRYKDKSGAMEQKVREAATRCNIEWYRPKWMTSKDNDIIYWIS